MISAVIPILIGLALMTWGGITAIRILKAEDPALTLAAIGDILVGFFEVFLGLSFITRVTSFGLIAGTVGLIAVVLKVMRRAISR